MAGEWSSNADLARLLTVFASVGGRPGAPHAAMAATDRPGVSAPLAQRQPGSGAAQHRRALRPVERAVRRVPRRDHDVLERAVRPSCRPNTTWPDLAAAQRRKIDRLLDVAGVRRGSRVLEIGTGWGELCHPRGRPRGARPLGDALGRAAAPGAAVGSPRQGCPTSVQIDLCDYRDVDSAVLRRRGVGRDDRGGRISRVAAVFRRARTAGAAGRPGSDPGHHHAARPDAGQPQHPHLDPEVHLSGRTATVHPGHRRHHRAADRFTHGRHDLAASALRRDSAAVAGAVHAASRRVGALGFRRGVRADVGAVPGLFGGGLPVRLPGCLPVDVRTRGDAGELR